MVDSQIRLLTEGQIDNIAPINQPVNIVSLPNNCFASAAAFLDLESIKNLRSAIPSARLGGESMRFPYTLKPGSFEAIFSLDIPMPNSLFLNAKQIKLPKRITDQQLAYLVDSGKLSAVTSLNLNGCCQLTDARIAELRKRGIQVDF